MSLNDLGAVAFSSDLSGTAGGTTDKAGIFLWNDGHLIQVARTGQMLLGSTISSLSTFQLNNADQVAYFFTLADGRSGVALWSVPEPAATSLAVWGIWLMAIRRNLYRSLIALAAGLS